MLVTMDAVNPAPKAQPRRLLIIEDTGEIRELLAELLSDEGYDVDVAIDGAEGLEQLSRGRYDLVLLDLMMPRVDGLELMRRLDRTMPVPPIIAMSAYERLRAEARELGAQRFLGKPVDIDRLLSEVDDVLHARPEGTVRPSAFQR